MKKLLSLSVGVLVSLGAQAQDVTTTLYVAGCEGTVINGQTLGAWDIDNPLEVEAKDGYFVLDCKNVQQYGFGISDLKTSDWAVWPQNRYAPSAAFTKADIGKEVTLYGPGADDFKPLWPGDWKLVISQDLTTVTVTTTTSPVASTYHLVGSFNSFACSDDYQFEPEEGVDNVFWLDITTALTSEMLNILRNQGWSEWWAPGTAPILVGETAQEWHWKQNPDGQVLTDYTGTMRLEVPDAITNGCTVSVTCYPDIREHKSTPSTGLVENMITEDAPAEYFNLQGIKALNPGKGIYIVRRGNKVTKEVIL